ncbi:11011_t:CDS:2 [Funneliformis mosseae]|uniref:11011_t:CDS:1 n=1 Tax=Funneliformis mosseae TaxID=27381 RepID=A0A9N9C7B1_FUNMO|nr:11011_t:CDS:2 [Funneliformis mosseae]
MQFIYAVYSPPKLATGTIALIIQQWFYLEDYLKLGNVRSPVLPSSLSPDSVLAKKQKY